MKQLYEPDIQLADVYGKKRMYECGCCSQRIIIYFDTGGRETDYGKCRCRDTDKCPNSYILSQRFKCLKHCDCHVETEVDMTTGIMQYRPRKTIQV